MSAWCARLAVVPGVSVSTDVQSVEKRTSEEDELAVLVDRCDDRDVRQVAAAR